MAARLSIADKYAKDVVNGKLAAPLYIIKACERYFAELKTQNTKDFPYYFDKEVAEAYIGFIQLARLTKGEWARKHLELQPFQNFMLWNIFGWRTKENKRRFTEVTYHVPKKNAKTELAAVIALACALLDNEYSGQIYMAATAQHQARLCFDTAKTMVKLTPEFAKHFQLLANSIYYKKLNTAIKAISSEAGGIEGAGSSCVIFDEEHEQLTNQLRDNLITGMAARSQPLFISISTAGNDRSRPYYQHIVNCKAVLNGISSDPRHFMMIYCPDENDEWNDPKVWEKVNPMFGISVKKEFIENQYIQAVNSPSKQQSFKTKHLNITSDALSVWIPHETWMRGNQDIKIEGYYGRECWCGLDLASHMDFTALAILIPDGDKFVLFHKFWIPEIMDKRTDADKQKFRNWSKMGFITLTDGNVTDYDVVENDILELAKNFNIKKCGYDDSNASQLVTNLQNEAVTMEVFSQGMKSMSPNIKSFEKLVAEDKIIHPGNSVMSWMMGNALIIRDGNDNIRVDRGKSTDKVDGVLATMDALGVYSRDMANEEQYFIG